MKKTLWMLGVAVAALTSCTQSEVLDLPESRVIGFDSFVGKETRADVVNDNAFNSFYVYCAKGNKTGNTFTSDEAVGSYYMNDVKVTRPNTNSVWSYETPKEWIINKYYRFAAYSNGHDDSETTNELENKLAGVTFNPDMSSTVKISGADGSLNDHEVTGTWGFTFEDYEANGKDLVVATSMERNTVQANSGQASVNLSFAHMLAKVQFKFSYYSEDTEPTTVEIMPFNMNAVKRANLDVFHNVQDNTTYANWSSQYVIPTGTNIVTTDYSSGDYTYFPNNNSGEGTIIEGTSIFYNNYVIPQKNNFTIGGITVKIYKGEGNAKILSSQYTYNDVSLYIDGHEYWRPGYIYRYEANLNASKQYIEFTASVNNWIDDQERDAVIGGTTTPANGDGE